MKKFAAVLLTCLIVSNAFGHEYWLEPNNFWLRSGEASGVRLFVGDALKEPEEKPYQPGKTDAFDLISNDGTVDLRSLAEADKMPILEFSSRVEGTYLLSMTRNWSYIKLDAAKFEDYLREDAMEYIIADRKRRGESEKEGRERYSRYIKSLIQVGDAKTSAAKTRVGTKIEIVPLENPYSKKVGSDLKLQAWFNGRPLALKTIFADNRDGTDIKTQTVTTDEQGRFTIKLDRKGLWLVRTVHMQRCEKNCVDADWESFWAALTFGVR